MPTRSMAFLVGMFAPVLGVLTTAVALFVWAAAGDEDGAIRRRRYAASVTTGPGAGTVVRLVLVFTIFFVLAGAAVFNPSLTPSVPPLP